MPYERVARTLKGAMKELHELIDAHPDPGVRKRVDKHARAAHAALDKVAKEAVTVGLLSGGDPKVEGV